MADENQNDPIATELQQIDQQVAQLRDREAQVAKFDRHGALTFAQQRAALEHQREGLVKEQTEVAELAKVQGLPLDAARGQLRAAKQAAAASSTNALTMDRKTYAAHRRAQGLY